MTIYFTSDLHLHHSNIIKYCNRPYSSVEEMDQALLDNWNSVVKPGDSVYVLGDLLFNPQPRTQEILSQMKGQKFLVLGNHDKHLRKDARVTKHFAWVRDYYELKIKHPVTGESNKVVLCHYPMAVWNRAHRGSYHLHGHCHGTYPPGLPTTTDRGKLLDVGVDVHNYTPLSLEQAVEILDRKQFVPVDGHGDRE